MKSILFVAMATAMLSAGIGTATATEPDENAVEYAVTDSTETAAVDSVLNSRSLGEVTVKGTRATVIQDGVSYIPSKKEKKYSMNPFILLKNMGITSIVVNGSDVSNLIGKKAALFIDGRPADTADIQTLLPKDVERVLVLESPGDAKYLGAKLAIDYITRKPIFGGYTIVSGNQNFIIDGGNYSLLGKFVNGKSIFQLLGNMGYTSYSGDYGLTTEKYDLPREDQDNLIIDRTSSLDGNRRKRVTGSGGFSWTYNRTDSCWMRLNGGVSIQKNPHIDSWGTNTDADDLTKTYSIYGNSEYISPYIYFQWLKNTRRGGQFYIKSTLNASFNRQKSSYNQDNTLDVYNKTRESGFAPHIMIFYYVPFGHNNSLQASLYLDESFYRVRYMGSANQSIDNREGRYELDLYYRHAINFGNNNFTFDFYTAFPVRHYKTGNLPGITDFTYNASLNMWLTFGSKSRLGASAELITQPVSLGQMVDVDIKEDDISGTRGNDKQISPTRYQLSLSYLFVPLRWLAFTVGSYYDHEANSFVTRYDAIGDVVYSSLVNSGVHSSLAFYWSGSVKLLDSSLNISPKFYVTRYYHNGLLDYDYWGVKPSISVTYFSDKGFWGSVSYSPPAPKEQYWGGSVIAKRHTHNLSIQAGYSIGNFSCDISVSPLYRYGRYEQITNLPGVNIVDNSYSKLMGRSISLSLKYVIDFGRKYPHGNDMYIESERVSSVR